MSILESKFDPRHDNLFLSHRGWQPISDKPHWFYKTAAVKSVSNWPFDFKLVGLHSVRAVQETMAKILLVDDDLELISALQNFLSLQGHVVETTNSGEDAVQLLQGFSYDLIVLDWGLPGLAGDEVCRTYRAQGGAAPVLFLTGKNDISFLETGFNSGADDYLVKPFDMRELTARMKGLLRRLASQYVAQLNIGGVELNLENRTITADGKQVKLRAKESALLEYLMRHPNKTFSAQNLLDAVWASDSNGTTHSVRTWMGTLRRQLAKLGKGELVKTELGSGYILECPDL